MKKWEYKIDRPKGIMSREMDLIEGWLNEQGTDGWELVSTTATFYFYFKRELK